MDWLLSSVESRTLHGNSCIGLCRLSYDSFFVYTPSDTMDRLYVYTISPVVTRRAPDVLPTAPLSIFSLSHMPRHTYLSTHSDPRPFSCLISASLQNIACCLNRLYNTPRHTQLIHRTTAEYYGMIVIHPGPAETLGRSLSFSSVAATRWHYDPSVRYMRAFQTWKQNAFRARSGMG